MMARKHSAAGFSLLEVLVTVAIVGVALTVISGIQRMQIRSLGNLRSHAEARLLLEQAVDRFQYGDATTADSLIAGEFSEYRLAFIDVVDLEASGSQPAALPDDPVAEQMQLLDVPEFSSRLVEISWDERGAEQQLAIEAWRFLPPDQVPPAGGAAP